MTLQIKKEEPKPPAIEVTLTLNGQEASDLMRIIGQVSLDTAKQPRESGARTVKVHYDMYDLLSKAGIVASKDFVPRIAGM